MDTSLSKALIIVAGVLLAMLVVAFITFSFQRMGTWATANDQELLAEQKEKFNKEYEAYDKNLMYGVDVISCLNKALSNNDKIQKKMLDASYEVKVTVSLKQDKPLQESIEVYHMNENGKELKYANDKGCSNVTLKDVEDVEDVEFEFLSKSYKDISNFDKSTQLKTQNQSCKKIATTMQLTKDGNATGEADLRALLSVVDTLSEVVKNSESKRTESDNWTKAEFRSALYDLKLRKFKCTKVGYSDQGRINEISFEEI